MAFFNPDLLPASGELARNYFLDIHGIPVSMEDVIVTDNLDIYDKKQIQFSPDGAMVYRGTLFSERRGFKFLDLQLQSIYHKLYAPKGGDFMTYRSQDKDDSKSSDSGTTIPPVVDTDNGTYSGIDASDSTGLLSIPFNIDGQIPLSHSYKQFEPRGYKLKLQHTTPEIMLDGLSKAVDSAGFLSRKRKPVGFNLEEVVLYNGLSCTPCRPSNLLESLQTSLFRQENFYDTPQDVYDILLPGLKLAERFMIDRSQIAYWSTLAFGTRVVDEKMSQETGYCHERLINRIAVTDEVYKNTLHLFDRMGKLVEYRFEFDEFFKKQSCFGFVQATLRRWNLAPEYKAIQTGLWPSGKPFPLGKPYPKDPWDHPQTVHLHPDFYTTAKRFSATKNHDVAARLRFNFWFAVNICHELGHVFELRCSQSQFEAQISSCQSFEDFTTLMNRRKEAGTREAAWGNSPWVEAGARWEWEVFGGRVHPINAMTDASLGMVLFDGNGNADLPPSPSPLASTGTCIQMSFMEEIQQHSFWSRPVRNLKFPKGVGAKAYLSTFMLNLNTQAYLIQRDQDIAASGDSALTDPKDIALWNMLMSFRDQNLTDDLDDRPSKRRRTDGEFSTILTTSQTGAVHTPPKRRRLIQLPIRRYMNKAAAEEKKMREEAAAKIARKEEEERKKEDALRREAAEARRRYRSPSPKQTSLHKFMKYPGEEFQDIGIDTGFEEEYVDPATKLPEDLSLVDKWTLAEEYICLMMGWEPIEFLGQRNQNPHWRPLPPFNPDDAASFDQRALDLLLQMRQTLPGSSWPERRAREKALYEQKRKFAGKITAIDELLTYLGYSRIESFRTSAQTGTFPLGISVLNFHEWQPMLDAFRLTQKIQESGEYRSALNRGDITNGGSVSALSILGTEGDQAPPKSTVSPTAKITDYFDEETEPHSVSPEIPLSKVLTPESMREKYEAWIKAGADIRSLPDGFNTTQVLSAALGGSLRTVLTEDLAKLVETRAKQLEQERAAERKARAEAAERRSKSSSKSKSSSSEL